MAKYTAKVIHNHKLIDTKLICATNLRQAEKKALRFASARFQHIAGNCTLQLSHVSERKRSLIERALHDPA